MRSSNKEIKGHEKEVDEAVFSRNKSGPPEPSFLLESINYMVAHRIGIDKKRIDDLKEEIKKTEGTVETLKKNPTPANLKTIDLLQARIEALTAKLEQLVKQFLQQQNEEEKTEDVRGE